MDNLGAILIGVAAILSIAVVFSVAAKVFSGSLVPLPVRELIEKQQAHINLLTTQNATLLDERQSEKAELRNLIAESTKANFAVHRFLDRYELLGGFAAFPPSKPPAKPSPPQERSEG